MVGLFWKPIDTQAFQQSLSTVPLLIGAALIVVYLILGILYESYIHPLTILSTLPSAGAGALATLMMFGYDFSVVAMIGVILLTAGPLSCASGQS